MLLFPVLPPLVASASLRIKSCYPWRDADLQFMQMSRLPLTVLTRVLKGLITLDNRRLTWLSSVLTVPCPVVAAAAASVFSLGSLAVEGHSLHSAGLFCPTVDLHRAVGKSESVQWKPRESLGLPRFLNVWVYGLGVCLKRFIFRGSTTLLYSVCVCVCEAIFYTFKWRCH